MAGKRLLCGAIWLFGMMLHEAIAAVPTFRISQVYSSLDGRLQYVVLTEWAGLDGQHRFAGLTLTRTAANGVVKQYVFPSDLPSESTAGMSIVVAAYDTSFAITDAAELGFNCCYQPEYRMPLRFLSIGAATLDFAGVDRVTYASLPTFGDIALYRDGTLRTSTLPANGRCYLGAGCFPIYRVAAESADVFAIEYHNAALDHYFHTALGDEIDVLDGEGSGWRRTGYSFYVATAGGGFAPVFPVCRYYIPPPHGDSHFLSVSPEECAAVAERFPAFKLETPSAFLAGIPDPVNGQCPRYASHPNQRMAPLYRLWNGRADSNHRYTPSLAVRDEMIARGYVSEGYGPMGVAMCI